MHPKQKIPWHLSPNSEIEQTIEQLINDLYDHDISVDAGTSIERVIEVLAAAKTILKSRKEMILSLADIDEPRKMSSSNSDRLVVLANKFSEIYGK